MFRIIDNRCTGKTYKLLMYAKENDAIFVCSNPYAMKQKSESYGIIGLTFVSYAEFLNNSRGHRDKFVVDEIEGLIRTINPFNELIGYTLSEE